MAAPKNISLQERALERAQRELEKAKRLQEQMEKIVAAEMKRLEDMRNGESEFNRYTESTPSLSSAAPASFQSQYDQFNTTKSNERLKPLSSYDDAFDFTEKLKPIDNRESTYQTSDRDKHWQTLTNDPGSNVYASGYYFSNGPNTKQYEYEVEGSALPLSVGDMVSAPVHYKGHPGQRPGILSGHDRRFIVTDIYSKEKFTPYHDDIK